MRQTISGLVAAVAVVTASAAPAVACGVRVVLLVRLTSSPARRPTFTSCRAATLAAVGVTSGWPIRSCSITLITELHQYYYVNQGPTYTGPGNFAPYPIYQERRTGRRVSRP